MAKRRRTRPPVHARPTASPRSPARPITICLGLALLCFVVFGNAVRFGFTNFDDPDYVYENPEITAGVTLHGIAWAFTHVHADNWHPVTTISHMLDCQLFGVNPGSHHLVNLLLHAATAILLFLVFSNATGAIWPSAFLAALFAIHPLRVESVAWIAERKDVLSGFFFVLTLAAYIRYVRRPSLLRYVSMSILYALGLMSKPMLVTVPFVLLLLDYWPLRRVDFRSLGKGNTIWRRLAEKAPLLVLSLLSCWATVLAQRAIISPIDLLPLQSRMGNALLSYLIYLRQMIWPFSLAVFYPYPGKYLAVSHIFLAALALGGITAGLFVLRTRGPYLLTGWLWYLGMLIPVIGIVQVGSQAHADRYTYLPQIGLGFAITWSIVDLTKGWRYRPQILGFSAAMLLVALGWRSWDQTWVWRDSESLWRHALAVTSNNEVAHNNLGNFLFQNNRAGDDVAEFRKALALQPNNSLVQSNLGNALLKQGMVDQAIGHFEKALQSPGREGAGQSHYDLGDAYRAKGQLEEAINHYRQAVAARPNYGDAHYNLGNALLATGRADEAIASYQRALQLHFPHPLEVHNNLASALLQKGDTARALDHFRQAVDLSAHMGKSKHARALYNLGNALLRNGQVAEAIANYRESLQLQPDDVDVENNLGNALFRQGSLADAAVCYEKAATLPSSRGDSGKAEARFNLGNVLLRQDQLEAAVAQYRTALQLQPDYSQAHNNMAGALLQLRRPAEAIEHYRKVLELRAGRAPNELAAAHYNLANALTEEHQLNEAAGHYEQAIELRPDYADAHINLGNALAQQRSFGDAIAHYRKAVEIEPASILAQNQLAWLLATCPDAGQRNAVEALHIAERANQLSGGHDAIVLRTLAAAYAENHQFARAREYAQSGLSQANESRNAALAESLEKELGLYQRGLSWRQ